MSDHSVKPEGVCAKRISFQLLYEYIPGEGLGTIVTDVKFLGGCQGCQKAISNLVERLPASRVVSMLKGIDCNGRGTSCPDQLARAVSAALEREMP